MMLKLNLKVFKTYTISKTRLFLKGRTETPGSKDSGIIVIQITSITSRWEILAVRDDYRMSLILEGDPAVALNSNSQLEPFRTRRG